jgi:DNA invertase Pin-like site-specific DNA recombinase
VGGGCKIANMTRALALLRLSKRNDKSTSLERQRAQVQAKAAALKVDELVIVEDPAVSGFRVHPLKRKKLAEALAQLDQYQILIYWRQDRFVRRVLPDFWDVVMLCHAHGVRMVSATEELGDPTVHAEMLPPFIKAWLAQGESESTSERMIDTKRYFRTVGRWIGGHPPYGYTAVPRPAGGWMLVIDDESAAIVREAVRRVIAGDAVNAVIADFNERKILTPYNYERKRAGLPLETRDGVDTSNARWKQRSLMRILRSPAMLGYTMHHGVPVIDEDGKVIICAPALITHQEWDQLQHALDKQSRTKRRTQTPSLLLEVACCLRCEGQPPMYRSVQSRGEKSWAYYRCARAIVPGEEGKPCPSLTIPADWLDGLAEELFLGAAGHVRVIEMVYQAGSGNAEEIAIVRRSLRAVRDEYDSGAYQYHGGQEDYEKRTQRLSGRLRELSDAPVVAPGYKPVDTGRTFAQEWERRDIPGRRQLMMTAGFKIGVLRMKGMKQPVIVHHLDEDLARRAGLAASGRPVELPAVETSDHDHRDVWRSALKLAERAAPAGI